MHPNAHSCVCCLLALLGMLAWDACFCFYLVQAGLKVADDINDVASDSSDSSSLEAPDFVSVVVGESDWLEWHQLRVAPPPEPEPESEDNDDDDDDDDDKPGTSLHLTALRGQRQRDCCSVYFALLAHFWILFCAFALGWGVEPCSLVCLLC